MRVLSPILNQVVYPILGKAGYFRVRASASVITYHGVLPQRYKVDDPFLDNTLLTIDAFRAQIRFLKSNYEVVSPDFFQSWLQGRETLPERAVLLTCDDGLLNNLTVMTSLLADEKLKCLFFVTGASAGKEPAMLWYIELYLMMQLARAGRALEWQGIRVPALDSTPRGKRSQWLHLTDELSRLEAAQRAEFLGEGIQWWGLDPEWKTKYMSEPSLRERFQLLQAPELQQLVKAGMTIGAHTLSHPMLSRQSEEMVRKEIFESKRNLEGAAGVPVWALAYPYGNPATVGDRELKIAEQAGYSCAFMNTPGNLEDAGRFSLPRVHVTANMSWGLFEANVSGFHHALQQRIRPGQVRANSQSAIR